jgi:uncharacterized protein YlxW (UPF0749 family)
MKTVIERFLAEATADEYPKAGSSSRHGSPFGSVVTTVVVLVTLALLGVVAVVAALAARSSVEERQGTRADLIGRVTAQYDTVAALQEEVAVLGSTVDGLRLDLIEAAAGAGSAEEVEQLAEVTGVTALSGPGVVVTIDDAPDAEPGSLDRVLDRDVQAIVNELWRMGAVGVAVNEQRLTQASAIRGAGEAILVNYQPLNRPYVVRALGIRSSGTEDGLAELLDSLAQDYGLVSDVEVGDVTLPAGELRDPRFAQSTGGSP